MNYTDILIEEYLHWYDRAARNLKLNFEDIAAVIATNKLKALDWEAIRVISQSICVSFERQEYEWPYQFQLMFNAWATENYVLNKLLNDIKFRNIINLELSRYNYKLADNYIFNDNPHDHNEFSDHCKFVVGSTVADIISTDTSYKEANFDLINTIEVKATVDKSATNYHNSQLVITIDLKPDAGSKTNKVKVELKQGSGYTPLITINDYKIGGTIKVSPRELPDIPNITPNIIKYNWDKGDR